MSRGRNGPAPALVLLLAILTSACSTGTESDRSFYLAAAPFRFFVSDTQITTGFDFTGFSGRLDAVSLHMDNFFGVPWYAFMNDADPPAAWEKRMSVIREAVSLLDLPVYLSLTPLSAMRNGIATAVREKQGELILDEQWIAGCVDFQAHPDAALIEKAYLRYVQWMVDFFNPVYLTHGIEVNIYERSCPNQYSTLIHLLNRVYNQIKSLYPDLVVFPTFTLADLYGYGDHGLCNPGDHSCLVENISRQDSLLRDRFGISAYPLFLQWEWSHIPEDYFTAVHRLTGESCVIAETGQGCYNVSIPWPKESDPCFTILYSSHADQEAYMKFVFESADTMKADLVVWWSLKDYLFEELLTSCPCSAPDLWCLLYQAVQDQGLLGAWLMWGSMGILDYRGNEKPVAGLWTGWLRKERTGRN